MRFANFLLFLILSALTLGQVATPERITPGTRIAIVCPEVSSLCREFSVGADGVLEIPIVGRLLVAGLDEPTLRSLIKKRLAHSGIASGDLQVAKLGSASTDVTFSGAVKHSGAVGFRQGMRLSEVFLIAQPTEAADLDAVLILASSGETHRLAFSGLGTASSGGDPQIRAGDAVFVPMASRTAEAFVLGEVINPGRIEFFRGITVRQALALVGGTTGNADLSKIQIERERKIVDTVNVGLGYDANLERGDIIRVPRSSAAEFVVVTGEVISSGQIPYRQGLRLTEAIKLAGGLKPGVRGLRISVARRINGNLQRTGYSLQDIYGRKREDPTLLPNDAIEVNKDSNRPSAIPAGRL
jgi:protein involved in polysaccharide export with SLBB domain